MVVDIPFVMQRLIPTVQPVWRTKEISRLQFTLGGRCPCYAVVQVPVLQLQFIIVVVYTPVVAQSLSNGPDSSSDLGFPSCFTLWSMPSLCRSFRFTFPSWRRGLSHGPDCLDHRDSQLQFLDKVIDAPVVQGVLVVDIPVMVPRPVPMVFLVRKTIETPLRSTFPGGRCPCCASLQVPGAVVVETVEISQLPLLRTSSFPGGPGQGC